jgi:hypothetical protein
VHDLKVRMKTAPNIARKALFSFLLEKKQIICYCFFISILFLNCSSDPCLALDKKIETFSKDGTVNISEFEKISEQVQKLEQCRIPSNNSCELQKFLQSKRDNLIFEKSNCQDTLPVLKIFIENSDSMDGYIRGSNDFKDSITNLAVRLKTVSGKIEFNFINSEIIPVKKQLEGFIKEIALNANSSYVKFKSNTFGSDLNSIFNKVLNNLESNEISIFITDGIYSIQESNNIQTELFNSQNLTMNAFIEAIQSKSISTLVLQYEANFDGNYYDMKHFPHQVKTKKPFYVFIVGGKELVGKIWREKSEDLKKNPKLKNYIYFNKEQAPPIPIILLSNYKKKGSKKINDRLKGSLGSIKSNESGIFGFSFITDYSLFKGIENIAENKINYKLSPLCEIEIEKYEETLLDSNEKIFLKKFQSVPTHIIAVECDKKIEKEDKITISLLKNNSNWVKESSLNNDLSYSNWIEFKTFGIESLISGISEAYEEFSRSDTFFTIQINLER